MRVLKTKTELRKAMAMLEEAAKEGMNSTCKSSHRGALLVQDGEIVGRGYNRPTQPELCCMRTDLKGPYNSERCTAQHAERMALADFMRHRYKGSMRGTLMYHAKERDGKPVPGGAPSCTGCSIEMLSYGVEAMVLWELEGKAEMIKVYDMDEFNRRSLEYHLQKPLIQVMEAFDLKPEEVIRSLQNRYK